MLNNNSASEATTTTVRLFISSSSAIILPEQCANEYSINKSCFSHAPFIGDGEFELSDIDDDNNSITLHPAPYRN